ncbi:MAG: GNAT family N-acetyltransferase [Bacilli bacterium]|nr:GNAT family N-acetyltransferase [Bacilli bacterium]
MQTLHDHLEKIHITPLGLMRIKENLHLEDEDIVLWCQETIKKADLIIGQGKNWYVYHQGVVITIHAKSYTLITAKLLDPRIRKMEKSDFLVLPEFLYQAIFIPEGSHPLSRDIIQVPEINVYIDHFGSKQGDLGVVAEQNGQIIGAAWTRIICAYGHVDDETPELAISILPEFRGYGIGTKLMKKLFTLLQTDGFKQTSLSVEKRNPAFHFYKRLGYEIIMEKLDDEGQGDYIMMKSLKITKK